MKTKKDEPVIQRENLRDTGFDSGEIEALGLSPQEYEKIVFLLGRPPLFTELAIFSAMWSEHCSYKSSRHWLKLLPSKGEAVIGNLGENAGIVDIGDGMAAVFKIESHNHPSFIEPYQGASTGVGGIMRDIFTMGARPVANLNSLHFGDSKHRKTDFLLRNVVAGIGDYGNCVGVPTVGGEVFFDADYNNNILVNAMCVGIAEKNRIFYSAAKGADNIILYAGAQTGRDGIHGASMASAGFNDDVEALKPAAQIGDPFVEKKLIEACLELMQHDAIIAIQDMGAAGLTSSCVEMAYKGNSGMEIDLDCVACRAPQMSASEIMLSESQERMLIVIKPVSYQTAKEIFDKWQLDLAVIGITNDSQKLKIRHKNEIVADLPITALTADAPVYVRKQSEVEIKINPIEHHHHTDWPLSPKDCLLKMLSHPNLCTRRSITEQYDSTVMANTMSSFNADAAIIRIAEGPKAIALSCDSSARYCQSDPFTGGQLSICECWRNLNAVGAKPLAFTNCLNFGNPQNPEVMAQFVAVIRGMRAACLELDFPVVSGNVSLYNETNNISIPPTPTIGGLGIIERIDCTARAYFNEDNLEIILIGKTPQELGQSRFYEIIHQAKKGSPPKANLKDERKNGLFVRKIIEQKLSNCVHDISDGGLMIAIAEMMLEKGIGVDIHLPKELLTPAFLFDEAPARYIIACKKNNYQKIFNIAAKEKIIITNLGKTRGSKLKIDNLCNICYSDIIKAYENPTYEMLKPL